MARLLGFRSYPNLQLKSMVIDRVGHLAGKPVAMLKAFEWTCCKNRVEAQVNPKMFEPYAGTYVLGGRDTVVIATHQGKRFAPRTAQLPIELLPTLSMTT
jgi:hypothetical protein